MGSAVLLRAVCSAKRWFRAVIFAKVSGGGFVFTAIWFGMDVKELGDESLLIAVEVAYVRSVFLGVLFGCFHG